MQEGGIHFAQERSYSAARSKTNYYASDLGEKLLEETSTIYITNTLMNVTMETGAGT